MHYLHWGQPIVELESGAILFKQINKKRKTYEFDLTKDQLQEYDIIPVINFTDINNKNLNDFLVKRFGIYENYGQLFFAVRIPSENNDGLTLVLPNKGYQWFVTNYILIRDEEIAEFLASPKEQ